MIRYYNCPKCKEFDDWRDDDKILTHCPTCHSPIVQQLSLNFQLKGPGFYSTDNRKEAACE